MNPRTSKLAALKERQVNHFKNFDILAYLNLILFAPINLRLFFFVFSRIIYASLFHRFRRAKLRRPIKFMFHAPSGVVCSYFCRYVNLFPANIRVSYISSTFKKLRLIVSLYLFLQSCL